MQHHQVATAVVRKKKVNCDSRCNRHWIATLRPTVLYCRMIKGETCCTAIIHRSRRYLVSPHLPPQTLGCHNAPTSSALSKHRELRPARGSGGEYKKRISSINTVDGMVGVEGHLDGELTTSTTHDIMSADWCRIIQRLCNGPLPRYLPASRVG